VSPVESRVVSFVPGHNVRGQSFVFLFASNGFDCSSLEFDKSKQTAAAQKRTKDTSKKILRFLQYRSTGTLYHDLLLQSSLINFC